MRFETHHMFGPRLQKTDAVQETDEPSFLSLAEAAEPTGRISLIADPEIP